MCSFFLISMICLLGNVSFIHFKCNMGHIQFMFHIYYTEFVAYKSWNNILIVLCVMPPWLNGRALVWISFIFCFPGRHRFEFQVRITFLVIFWPKISSIFSIRKSCYFCIKGTRPKGQLAAGVWRVFNSIKEHYISLLCSGKSKLGLWIPEARIIFILKVLCRLLCFMPWNF